MKVGENEETGEDADRVAGIVRASTMVEEVLPKVSAGEKGCETR